MGHVSNNFIYAHNGDGLRFFSDVNDDCLALLDP